MKVKRYELKARTTVKDILKCGAKENKDGLFFDKYIEVKNSDIRIHLSFSQNLKEWNDIDGVSVINTDSGELYKPFYEYRSNGDDAISESAINVISGFNEFMDSFPFLKIKKKKG